MLKMADSMKIRPLVQTAQERLFDLLRRVPLLARTPLQPERLEKESRADFFVSVPISNGARSAARRRTLVCGVASSGQPRIAREACRSLAEVARKTPGAYPVFIAPYVSPAAAAVCEEYKTGYLDFAGNCRLAFDWIFLEREGFANPNASVRDLRSLYSPKAERMLRALLSSGPRMWRTQTLADTARVSLGQVASVKKLLADREWIESGPAGFGLAGEVAALQLLAEWASAYRAERNSAAEFYSIQSIPEVEARLAAFAGSANVQIAFTTFSGAARLAPAVRYQRATIYVSAGIETLAEGCGLKRVSSGSNVTLIDPYDDGVFFGAREVDGAPVASPVQIYLDLMQTKGRGEEAAAAILGEVIKPLWR